MTRLAALPKPKETEWELELPEEQQEKLDDADLVEEDAADRDRQNAAIQKAAEQAEFERRTQVLKKSLPRPAVIDIESLFNKVSAIEDPIEKAIAHEMSLLIANDALKHPVPGSKVSGTLKPLETFSDDALHLARLAITTESSSSSSSSPLDQHHQAMTAAWDELHSDPASALPTLVSSSNTIDTHQLLLETFTAVQDSLLAQAQRGNAVEKKLALHLGGYQARAKTLRQKIVEAAAALEDARTGLATARVAFAAEEAAVGARLEGLREEFVVVGRREREVQGVYRVRREELDSLR